MVILYWTFCQDFRLLIDFFSFPPEIDTVCHLHIVEKSMEKYWWPAYVCSWCSLGLHSVDGKTIPLVVMTGGNVQKHSVTENWLHCYKISAF